MSTTTTRQQVYVDLFLIDTAGAEVGRVWRGAAQIAPINRTATPCTTEPCSGTQVSRFKFQPGGIATTVGNGQKLRFKITSKYAKAFPGEPLPATYTLYHNTTYPSNVKLTFVS